MRSTHARHSLVAFIALCVPLFVLHVFSIECRVGDATVAVPPPQGFAEVREVSAETFSIFEEMCPPANRLLAVFVTQRDVGRLIRGQTAELSQSVTVQSAPKLDDITLAKHQFKELRHMLRKQYDTLFQKQRAAIDEATVKAGQALSKRLETDIAFQIGGVVPLGVDHETASAITLSQLAKFDMATGQQQQEHVVAGTIVVLLVKGKVLYLNIYRTYHGDADLAWTRSTAKQWAAQILADNSDAWPASGRIVPSGTPVNTFAKELLAGDMTEYRLAGHSKAHDLVVSLKYPASWRAAEGVRPHIAQKFSGVDAAGFPLSCMVIVQELPDWAHQYLEGDLGEEILLESIRDMVPASGQFIDGGPTKIDGEPGAWLKYYYQAERTGLSVGMYALRYVLFYRGCMLAVQCAVACQAQEKELIEDAFTAYLPVFQAIGNSIVIHDKWVQREPIPPPELPSDPVLPRTRTAHSPACFPVLALLISALLAWGIGLAPPLFTRFAILQHPMSKAGAITFVVIFGVLNVVLFTAMGRTIRTHGALLLVGWASFAILRKGSRKYDTQCKRDNEEREMRERERKQHAEEQKRWRREQQQWEQQANHAKDEARRAQEEARRRTEEAHRRAEEARQRAEEQQRQSRAGSDPHVPKNEAYYASVLGLSGKVTRGDVRRRYRDLAGKYHPDRVNHLGEKLKETAEKEMKVINESFDFFKKKYGM